MMTKISYGGYRFPPEIIQQTIWLYVRFTLSFRNVEDLLAERGIIVSYETVRRWVNHFGPMIAADLRKRRPKPHTIWHNAAIDACTPGLGMGHECAAHAAVAFVAAARTTKAPDVVIWSRPSGAVVSGALALRPTTREYHQNKMTALWRLTRNVTQGANW